MSPLWVLLACAGLLACSDGASPDPGDTALPSGAAGTGPSAGATAPPSGSAGQGASGMAGIPAAGASGQAGGGAGTPSPTPQDAGTIDASADAAIDAAVTDDAGPDGGSGADDRCDVAVLDPANPPRVLELSGNLGTHDPALIAQDGTFYLWHTGPRLPGKISTDLRRWDGAPAALGASNPAWISQRVPGATDLWAPDLSYFGGRYHLYYSASTFGSNTSCIGHASRQSLTGDGFEDHGPVICSSGSNDWNAIDPNVIVDEQGTPWLSFGSFWSGIQMVRLDQDGARADDQVHHLASRGGGAIEAPFIVRRCGFYYLFVSFDRCCNGASSTYNMRVGRSTEVLGPYVDRNGTRLLDGGGTPLVMGDARFRGPGHNAVLFDGDRAYNVYHAYDADRGGAATLRIAELAWDADGWPVSGGP